MKNKAGKALTLQELEQVAGGTAISRSEIQQIMQSLPDVNTDRNSRGQRTRLEGVPLDK